MRARLLTLLAVISAAPAWAADPNVISSVEVKDAGNEVVVTIQGTRKPSFTTFSMADPPRFVIDFSESKFEGVPEEMPGAGGVVQQVKNLSYGSGATAIARVMMAFSVEVDPPAVEDAGNALVVRIAKPAGEAAVAAAGEAPPAAVPPAQVDPDAQAKAEADARAKADADAKAQADAEAQAEAERKAQAEADAQAKAQADADAKAQADAKVKAEADAKARADADAKAQADADAAAKVRADAEAGAVAVTPPAVPAAEEAEQKLLEEEIASAEQEKAPPAAAQAPEAAPLAPAAAESGEDQSALEAEIAAAREQARKEARDVEGLSAGAPPARLREVGFKQLAGISRVFVRTSADVQYSVEDLDDRTVRIELANTRVMRNNDLRFLDTSFFPSAVQLITPSRQGSSYVLTVKLRERVPYEKKRVGDMLAIDFQRPAAPAAGKAAPAEAAEPTPAEDGEADAAESIE